MPTGKAIAGQHGQPTAGSHPVINTITLIHASQPSCRLGSSRTFGVLEYEDEDELVHKCRYKQHPVTATQQRLSCTTASQQQCSRHTAGFTAGPVV